MNDRQHRNCTAEGCVDGNILEAPGCHYGTVGSTPCSDCDRLFKEDQRRAEQERIRHARG